MTVKNGKDQNPETRGWVGWLLRRFERSSRPQPQLELLARISLAPKQTVALVQAEGCRLLVATSADGSPAFYPLSSALPTRKSAARISW